MTFDNLIKEFWESNRQELEYNYHTIYDIIMSLFKGLRDAMSDDNYNDVRIKYLGLFKANTGKLLIHILFTIARFDKGLINERDFLDSTLGPLKYLLRHRSKYMTIYKERYIYIIKYYKKFKHDRNC